MAFLTSTSSNWQVSQCTKRVLGHKSRRMARSSKRNSSGNRASCYSRAKFSLWKLWWYTNERMNIVEIIARSCPTKRGATWKVIVCGADSAITPWEREAKQQPVTHSAVHKVNPSTSSGRALWSNNFCIVRMSYPFWRRNSTPAFGWMKKSFRRLRSEWGKPRFQARPFPWDGVCREKEYIGFWNGSFHEFFLFINHCQWTGVVVY